MNIVFATNNPNKIHEVKKLLPKDYKLLSLKEINCFEELEETANTLEGNSLQKAKYVFEKYNMNCFADDTGLEVEALGGKPGVYSARYAGPDGDSEKNIQKLLAGLNGVENRNARFRTVISLLIKNELTQFEGIVNGKIIEQKRGESGFGYDPIFIPDGYNQTFAQLDIQVKNQISHRGKAVRKLVAFLSGNQFSEK